MNEELKRALEELKNAAGAQSAEVAAHVARIEQAHKDGTATVAQLRGQIETIQREMAQRDETVRSLQNANRVRQAAADPIVERREAVSMFGMIMRQELCRRHGMEVPSAFAAEGELVRSYQQHVLQRTTLQVGSTPGSYVVPTVMERTILDTLEEVSDLLAGVDFIPGLPAASTIYIPTLTGRPTLQPTRATMDTGMTASNPGFGQFELAPKEAYCYFPVDNRLLQMAAFDLGSLLMSVLRDGVTAGINDWLINADGSATYNSMYGILLEPTSDYIVTLPSNKTAFADVTAQDLRKAKANVLKRGRARGKWLGALDVLGLVEDLDRTGKVPVASYGPDGVLRILGNEAATDEYMPDLTDTGAGKVFLGFGDFKTFIVGLVGGIQIASSDQYKFGENLTCFRAVVNMAIKRKPIKTFVVLKTAAGG